jgi:hypothetical protein
MAVIQISKIQVRRGLQENLPQLASGEMGWSVDTQRLYIGNGTLIEGAPEVGNTEIVTAGKDILSVIKSYTFDGRESGYTSITGPDRNSDVQRYFQDKLDEQVSLRDFVTDADNISGDYTTAIQRAIDQIYPTDYYSTVGVRRKLHIPAGTWLISSSIYIPPYANIYGDGSRSTIIKLTTGNDPVIQLKDSRGNVGATINTVTSDAPFQINISDLTLQTDEANDIAVLDSCQIVTFDGVRFQGANTLPITAGTSESAVLLLSSAALTNKITFNRCEFSRTIYGVTAEGAITDILINDSKFDTLYKGIHLKDDGTAPNGIKIISSTFDNIATQAIYAANNSFISNASSYTSAFNHFKSVGRGNGVVMDSGTVTSTILNFATSSSYSIGDIFDDGIDTSVSLVTIAPSYNTPANTVIATTSGSTRDYPGEFISVDDGTTANVYTLGVGISSAIIDYKITRNGTYRIGTISVSHDLYSNAVVFADDYNETVSTGVTLNFTGYTDNTAVLSYTSTSTGNPGYLSYSVRTFI